MFLKAQFVIKMGSLWLKHTMIVTAVGPVVAMHDFIQVSFSCKKLLQRKAFEGTFL